MITKLVDKVFRLLFMLAFLLGTFWVPGHSAEAQGPDPTFSIWPTESRLDGTGWLPNLLIQIVVDDPATGLGADYNVSTDTNDEGSFYYYEDWGGFDLQPGFLVAVDDGVHAAKQHVMTGLTFAGADHQTDTVWGMTDPGAIVDVSGCGSNGCATRHEIADGNGNWIANFGAAGNEPDEQDIVDLQPGDNGDLRQSDEDGDFTYIYWLVPNPRFSISRLDEHLEGWDWLPGTLVTLTVDDPSNGPGAEFSSILTANGWGDFRYGIHEGIDLQPGFLITLNGGVNYTKQHTIANLSVRSADPETDIVSGTGNPGAVVDVTAYHYAVRHVTVDGDGHWSANFAVLGSRADEQDVLDLQSSPGGNATQSDEDGDFSQIRWRVPQPSFQIWLNDDFLYGAGWLIDSAIEITVDDPATGPGADFSTTIHTGDADYFNYALGEDFDLQPGFIVTLNDGVNLIRKLTIPGLAITNIDLENEIVHGITIPDAIVHIWGCTEDCADRHEVADEDGNWAANFAVPGDEPDEQGTMDLRPDSNIYASQNDEDGDSVEISQYIRNSTLSVHANGDWLEGNNWEPNTTVDISFDDPTTPLDPDYTTSVASGNWNSDPHYFSLSLGGAFDIKPGFLVTATDGHRIKELTVSGLLVMGVNPNEDTVWGRADPNSPLRVHIFCPAYAIIEMESDSGGHWTADFTGQCDLVPNHRGRAEQLDADGDSTADDWRVRNPAFSIGISSDQLHGWDWTPNMSVQITVDNPTTGPGADFSTTVGSDQQGSFHYGFLPAFDLQTGFIVTLDDGIYTKEHVIVNLPATSADAGTDTVRGTAGPGSSVRVSTCWSNGCAVRHEIADENGNWTANFATPGDEADEQDIFDLQPGTWGGADQYDADGDYTNVYWQVPKPNFGVYPVERQIYGWQWRPGATVQVTAGNCPATTTADGLGNFFIQLPNSCVLQPGNVVRVDDATSTKTHLITNLTVTSVDDESDTVSGTAQPGSIVDLWACGPTNCANRHEVADANGNWSANFHVVGDQQDEQTTFELQPGQGNDAVQRDVDGDSTSVRWRVPRPIIWGVTANSNWINGQDWQRNASVHISIDNPSTPQNPDSTTTQSTDANGNFIHQSQHDISVGSVVSVTDGHSTKQVTVSNFEVTAFDATTGTLSGVGTPNTNGGVWILDPQGWTPFVIDSSGHWRVDLSGAADLASWSHGFAIEQDSDGDGTQSNWPSHNIEASINGPGHSIEGHEWHLDSSITLTIDNPGNGAGTDYEDIQTVGLDDWGATLVEFDLEDFRLETGAVVTLTDGTTTRTHTVTYLDITYIDADTDRVLGKAEPGSAVEVSFRSIRRRVVADGAGNWMADFSIPGSGSDEQALFDIHPGIWAGISQYGHGRNMTRLHWQVPDYRVVAYPDWDIIAATDFWPGAPVTITVDDPGNGVGVDLTRNGVVNMEPGGQDCQTWWGYCFVLELGGEFDVQAGDLITITDGTHTVSHIVTPLAINEVDIATSTLAGIAEPLGEINLQLWPSCGERHLVANEEGHWLEDFSVPGDEDFEQRTCDFGTDELRWISANERSGEGETWVDWSMSIDLDGDGVTDDIDNAPAVFNPDQRDVDNDGTADVLDPCPDDATNACDTNGSAADVIGEQGGTIAVPNGMVSLNIPVGSVHEDISFTITDMGGGYELASDQGPMMVVHSYSIQPHGTQFDPPASITFRWDDANDDGIVDGTTAQEVQLRLIKDGLAITPPCSTNPDCNMVTNELTVQISGLSLFALAVPIEWTLKGFYQPVDMNGVYNVVKGGSTVPLKFEIFAGSNELTDTAYVKSLTSTQTSCDANVITDDIETIATGGTNLRYDSFAGQFIYNWKTPKNAGKCYRLTMTTTDGSSLVAYFKLK